jgi:hypothetical protein
MSTIKSLDQLSKVINPNDFLKLIESQIKYPKTSDIDTTTDCIQTSFDCSNNSALNTLLAELKININLKYFGLTDDIIFTVKNLFNYKDTILLSQADYLIIEKNNFCLLRLENSSKPNSGRSIVINVNNFRSIITSISDEIMWKKIKYGALLLMFGVLAFRSYHLDYKI